MTDISSSAKENKITTEMPPLKRHSLIACSRRYSTTCSFLLHSFTDRRNKRRRQRIGYKAGQRQNRHGKSGQLPVLAGGGSGGHSCNRKALRDDNRFKNQDKFPMKRLPVVGSDTLISWRKVSFPFAIDLKNCFLILIVLFALKQMNK